MAAAATSTRNADRSMKKALPVKPAALIFIAVFYAGQLIKLIINEHEGFYIPTMPRHDTPKQILDDQIEEKFFKKLFLNILNTIFLICALGRRILFFRANSSCYFLLIII
ncbi:MAG: hypothetical protein ACLVHV_16040 [Oscillospiraceae bacterium]